MMEQENRKRFQFLLSKTAEDNLTDCEASELIALCENSEDFRSQLSAQLHMDAMLFQSMSKQVKNNETFTTDVLNDIAQRNAIYPSSRGSSYRFIGKVFLRNGLILLVTMLLIAAIWWGFASQLIIKENNKEWHDTGVAVVVSAVGDENEGIFVAGQSLAPGRFTLRSGFIELEFYLGARVKIGAPADFEIIDASRIVLHDGKILSYVPQVASGFTINAADTDITSSGSQSGVAISQTNSVQVHLFNGAVALHNSAGKNKTLEQGDAIFIRHSDMWENVPLKSSLFQEFDDVTRLRVNEQKAKHERWLIHHKKYQADPRLVAYYDFQIQPKTPRRLINRATSASQYDGAIVGARWSDGPWPGKNALEFKRPGDRVRINIPYKFTSFTFAAWVKIDSLDRLFSAILLTDGFDVGEMHWQLGRFHDHVGTLVLGLAHREGEYNNYNYTPFMSVGDSGKWFHLATSVDGGSNEVNIYIDGVHVKRTPLLYANEFWHIGNASIGNWDSQQRQNPLRNLNGSIAELMIFDHALDREAIFQMANFDTP